MFERARELVEQYYCVLLRKNVTKRAEHSLHELRGRLRQLQWLHMRLMELERRLVEEAKSKQQSVPVNATHKLIFTDAARPDCEKHIHARLPFQKSDELRVLLEAFYYSAHRIRNVLRDCADDLPGISGFEAVGVRNVRNHLVEHPDGKSGVLVFSFAAGGPVGPQMKTLRWSNDPDGTFDEGLHKNAAEFQEAIERTIEQAIKQCAA